MRDFKLTTINQFVKYSEYSFHIGKNEAIPTLIVVVIFSLLYNMYRIRVISKGDMTIGY